MRRAHTKMESNFLSLEDLLVEQLKDPEFVNAYLDEALQDEDIENFMISLSNILKVHTNLPSLAKKCDFSEETLYKIRDRKDYVGVQTLFTLINVLKKEFGHSKNGDVILGEETAQKILENNYLTEPPIDVESIAKNYGLHLFAANFNDDRVAGCIDLEKEAILINRKDIGPLHRFTIAHELGHWLMHTDEVKTDEELRFLYRKPLGGETNPLEIQANAFAAYLLVPDFLLKTYLSKPYVSRRELAEIFNVSESVIGFRKEHLRRKENG